MNRIVLFSLLIVGLGLTGNAFASVDTDTLTRAYVTCSLPGTNIDFVKYVAFRADGISYHKNNTFSLSGYELKFANEITAGDRKEEKAQARANKVIMNIDKKVELKGCGNDFSQFRTIGNKRVHSLESYLKVLPFQEKCEAEFYNTCVDSREVYNSALNEAKVSGKPLLILYGYSGCAWCDALQQHLQYLEFFRNREGIEQAYYLQLIGTSSTNRTGKKLIANLKSRVVSTKKFDGGSLVRILDNPGLPMLLMISPINGKVSIVGLETMEFNYVYDLRKIGHAIELMLEHVK